MFHSNPVKVYIKQKRNANQPASPQEKNALPSTSKEPSKNQESKAKQTINLPHITSIPSNSQAKGEMKYLQLSPIQNLPKQELQMIQSNAIALPRLEVANLKTLQVPLSMKDQGALKSSNIKVLRQITHVPIALPSQTPVLQQLLQKPLNKPIVVDLFTSSSPAIHVSQSRMLTTPKKSPPKIKHTPCLLRKKISVSKNPIKTNISIPKSPSTSEKLSNINNKETLSSWNHDITFNKGKQTIQSILNEHKAPKRKESSPRKRRRDRAKEKDQAETNQSVRTEENFYIADGFRADVDTLLEKCSQISRLNFEKFTNIWKEINFPRIFEGRQSGAELAEFSEEVIHIAKSHMLAKNVGFEENVAGLFLVYALLNHQPFPDFASLRLVPADVPVVRSLEMEARRQKRHDVLYILRSVLIKGPCQFHVSNREVALEIPIRKYHDGTVQVSEAMESVFTRNAVCVQYFKELMSLEPRYQALLQRVRNNQLGKIRKLCKQPASALYEEYRAHIPRGGCADVAVDTPLSPSAPKVVDDRTDLVRTIKEKAMSNVVDSMRHLTGVEERLLSSDDSDYEPPTRNPRVKGKGRGSALTLQNLSGPQELLKNQQTDKVLETSPYEMPSLDAIEGLTTEMSNKDKPSNKKANKKVDDDSKNNNQNEISKTRKNNVSPGKKNSRSMNIRIINSYSIKDQMEDVVERKKVKKKEKTDGTQVDAETLKEEIHESSHGKEIYEAPSTTIDIERVNEYVEVEPDSEPEQYAFRGFSENEYKIVRDEKIVSPATTNNVESSSASPKKVFKRSKTGNWKCESPVKQTRKSTRTSPKWTPNKNNNRSTPELKSPRASQRVKDQISAKSPENISFRKRIASACEEDYSLTYPKKKLKKGNKRLQSSFRKLGISEVANMSSEHSSDRMPSTAISFRKKGKR